MIDVQVTNTDVEKALRILNPNMPEQAVKAAAMRTLGKLRTKVKKDVGNKYEVKQSDVTSTGKLFRTSDGAMLKFVGPRIGLEKFSPKVSKVQGIRKPHRQQVTVQIKKGQRKVLRDGFEKGGGIFRRKEKDGARFTLVPKTIGIPTMVYASSDEEVVAAFIEEDFEKQLNNQLEWRMKKALGM